MPYFDRFDVVEAYSALECDYNLGGWLRERPTNQRRMQACSVQLHRLKFRARPNLCFETLSENGQEIYLHNVFKLKLSIDVDQQARFIRAFGSDWLDDNFPQSVQ